MKKFLLVITVLLLSISLVGCNSPTDLDKIEELEARVEVLENRIDQMVSTVGLNGQVDWYENNGIEGSAITVSATMMEMAQETDYIDKAKFPEYIFGTDGEYISIQELNHMLCQKYLNTSCNSSIGFQYKIQAYKPNDMTINEYMVRISMLIEELSYYDFYTIDSPELYIEFTAGGSQYMKVRMSLLVDDKYNIDPAIFWNGLMDTRIEGLTFSTLTLNTIHADLVASGELDGFVLPNYK